MGDGRPASSTACAGSGSTGTKGRTSAGRTRRTSSRSGSTGIARGRRSSSPAGTRTTATARPRRCRRSAQAAEAAGGGWIYDRTCCALTADEIARLEAAGAPRAVRFRVPDGTHAIRRSGARPDRVRQRQHRGLRHPALRSASPPITSRSSPTTSTWRITPRRARRRSHLEHAEARAALSRRSDAPCRRSRTCR